MTSPMEQAFQLADNGNFLQDYLRYTLMLEEERTKKEEEARKTFKYFAPIMGESVFDIVKTWFDKHYTGAEYHDWYHTCCMIVNCQDAYAHWKDVQPNAIDRDWKPKELRTLLFAAAFHDIGHTGGREIDTVNVGRAVALASDFLHYAKSVNTEVDKDLVIRLIRVTEFPFIFEPQTELEKIIRDADLLQILEPTWFPVIYINLLTEIGRRNPTLSFAKFCQAQKDFLHSAHFQSRWWLDKKCAEFGGIGLERANTMAELNPVADD